MRYRLSDRQKNLTCQDRLGADRRKRWKNGVCAQVVAATPYTFLSGKKHPFWFSLFSVSSRIRTTYQDRLGTNVEVKLKKKGGGHTVAIGATVDDIAELQGVTPPPWLLILLIVAAVVFGATALHLRALGKRLLAEADARENALQEEAGESGGGSKRRRGGVAGTPCEPLSARRGQQQALTTGRKATSSSSSRTSSRGGGGSGSRGGTCSAQY